jgi:hypothetical protein
VRIAGQTFTANARFITAEAEPELHGAIASLSIKKYGWGDGTILELVPESSDL